MAVSLSPNLTSDAAAALGRRSLQIMADGTRANFDEIVHPEAVNREAISEPPAARGRGPDAFWATALWLRRAFADLAFELHEVVVDGDLVVVHDTMSGRQVGPMVIYDAAGKVEAVMPPRGRRFATTQTHWMRLADGKVIEHWANRDDLGTARQLGWVPPTPWYLLRMAIARRQVRAREVARDEAA
jgi:predicted ester cyclase